MSSLNCYDAEFSLLSIMCQYKETLGILSDKLKIQYFTDTNRVLYSAIKELYDLGLTIDTITLSHILKRIKDGRSIPPPIVQALFAPADETKFDSYLSIIVENYRKLQYRMLSREIETAIKDGQSSVYLSEILNKYSDASDGGGIGRPRNLSVVAKDVAKETEEIILNSIQGVSDRTLKFGVPELDRHDSMRPGNIYLFAGLPGSGKTSLAVQVAYNNAFQYKKRILFFSLEMCEEEVLEQIYCHHNRVSNDCWLRMPNSVKLKELNLFSSWLDAQGIQFIIDDKSRTVDTIINRSKVLCSQTHVDMIIVDFIQLMEGGGKSLARHAEIEYIMTKLKNGVAKDLKTIVVLLSQMNRTSQNEEFRIPVMSDLKDSSSIEQIATSIYFLHRVDPMVRRFFDSEGRLENLGQTLLVCQKARFSKKGILQLWFAGECKMFVREQSECEKIAKIVAENDRRLKILEEK